MFRAVGPVFVPRLREMLCRWQALQIVEGIVEGVGIPMMDVASNWDRPESTAPYVLMQALAASCQIPLARPHAVETAIEILCERVKDDWISEPG